MTEGYVISFAMNAIVVTLKLAAPFLLASLMAREAKENKQKVEHEARELETLRNLQEKYKG